MKKMFLVAALMMGSLIATNGLNAQSTTPVQKSEDSRVERKKELANTKVELEKKEAKYAEKEKEYQEKLNQLESDYKAKKVSAKDYETTKIDLETQRNNARKAADEIKAERKRVGEEIKSLE